MENKINIAELLKDCPEGMELECTLIEGLEFDAIIDNEDLPIRCRIKNPNGGYNVYSFTKYGCLFNNTFAKCVIFPKGKNTWEGFVPPIAIEFKDGDVIVDKYGAVAIYKRVYDSYDEPYVDFYCGITSKNRSLYIKDSNSLQHCGEISSIRLATEEEKQELFQAIKANGYHWNAETKTLENLLKFKVGNKVRPKGSDKHYIIENIEFDRYILNNNQFLKFTDEHDFELVPNKFDINTLVPFESKVLVRSGDSFSEWKPAIFGIYRNKYNNFYVVGGTCWKYCIPYEGNEHLLGTTNDCKDFYKTWENEKDDNPIQCD